MTYIVEQVGRLYFPGMRITDYHEHRARQPWEEIDMQDSLMWRLVIMYHVTYISYFWHVGLVG